MGKAEARALKTELTQLLAHLLKLAYSPATDPRSHWEQELILQRLNIEALLSDNPGSTPRMVELHASAWNSARRLALAALRQDGARDIPEANPFTLEQVRHPDCLPGQSG